MLPALQAALAVAPCAVLIAPPGSGKTSRVPGALLDGGLLGAGRVVMLQPRRVAARLAARRIASERGVELGQEVGYRVRFEDRTSPRTRIEVVTEGVLTRRIQSDPFLDGVSAVILDEFHERHLEGDLALALLDQVRREARPDLKLLVMSATLDPAPLVRFLGRRGEPCPVLRAEGRRYPVELLYDPRPDERYLPERIASAVRELLRSSEEGHVLAFHPGVGEIDRVAELLGDLAERGVAVLPLHGRLSLDEQDRALRPSAARKVVLSTNIAESSVTLAGVVGVVDCGLHRTTVFDPALGLGALQTLPISTASADQRAGRAGRTGPGLCRRLWTAGEQRQRPAADLPEVARADLAGVTLELLAWGVSDLGAFGWYEAPPEASLERARALLRSLGALSLDGLTALGRDLAPLPLHPRLARVVVEGHRRGCLRAAATAAALTSERDPWERAGLAADLCDRVGWVDRRGTGADPRALHTVKETRDQLVRVALSALGPARREVEASDEAIVRCLLAGFPDRVGQRRTEGGGRFRLADGRGAALGPGVEVGAAPLLLAAGLEGSSRGPDAIIRLAAVVEEGWLPVEVVTTCLFDPERQAVVAREETRFGALLLRERPSREAADPAAVAALLAAAALERGGALDLEGEGGALLDRLRFLAGALPELGLPDWSADLHELIPELCLGRRSLSELRGLDLSRELLGRLTYAQREALDREAPASLTVPSGAQASIDYSQRPPVLSARVQQLFGMKETPRIAQGRVALMVHLTAPNNRPVQVTRDLSSFWANTYAEVRKDLRGRYPRHAWPEDPTTAIPENRPARRPR